MAEFTKYRPTQCLKLVCILCESLQHQPIRDDTFQCFQDSEACILQYKKLQVSLLFESFEKPLLHYAQT